jgi:hypothetical protein
MQRFQVLFYPENHLLYDLCVFAVSKRLVTVAGLVACKVGARHCGVITSGLCRTLKVSDGPFGALGGTNLDGRVGRRCEDLTG